MSKSERVKPQFGREMIPCEYKSQWANRLSKDDIVVIKAENIVTRKEAREDR